MPDPTDLPNLAALHPLSARYLRALGLDRIPAHTWSQPVEIKLVVETVGELGGTGNRLRKPRYEATVRKLADAQIYLQFLTGVRNYGDFSIPMSVTDESPGMEATVRVSYHPGGFNGQWTPAINAPIQDRYEPPASRPSEPSAGQIYDTPRIKPLNSLTPAADETHAAIEAIAEDPSFSNLHRLRRRLLKLQGLLRLIAPEVDGTIKSLKELLRAPSHRLEEPSFATFWLTEPRTAERFDDESEAEATANPSQTQRALGGLAQLFKDDHADHEETDCL